MLADVRSRLADVVFPLEYHYELVGNYAHHQKVAQRILVTGLVAAIAIFLLLQAIFGRWRLAALLFAALPLALVGSAVAVRIDGGTMELGSLVGFLTVFGVAVRNGVILLRRFQSLERDDGVEFGPGVVVAGARERFAPTLLTALAVGLFFAPFAFLGDLPGHEIVNPMGGVIVGGLVTADARDAVPPAGAVPALRSGPGRDRGARPARPVGGPGNHHPGAPAGGDQR